MMPKTLPEGFPELRDQDAFSMALANGLLLTTIAAAAGPFQLTVTAAGAR